MRTSARPSGHCPLPPARQETTYSRALHRACLILGGERQLAKFLRVDEADLVDWLEARGDPPEDVFLGALDVILQHLDVRRRN